MSITYHAYQNRGYRFSVHEVLAEQWTALFKNYDPARIADILHLKYDETYLYIPCMGEMYRLKLSAGSLEKETDDGWQGDLFFNESMCIYHLLHYTKDTPVVSGVWVPFESLEGQGQRKKLPDPLLVPFSKKFAGKTAELEKACKSLGETFLSKGDVSCEFEFFPGICLQLIFWDEDEDFPAQTQILADKTITDFVHTETVGCMISELLEKIENRAAVFS